MTSESAQRAIGVAVLGLGTVGSEVARIIREHSTDLEARVGARLELRGVAVRRIDGDRGLPEELLTTDAESLVTRDDVDVVVEVIGGIELPRKLVLAALNAGKSVVTANKALLAEYTGELAEAAERQSVDLYFEAAVAGAIPVIRPLTQSLAGDRVDRVLGIVNGTTNFILSAMDETGADYADTLAEAGRLGYAEADPTADVEGFDAASKAAILASIAFHTRVTAGDVYREGISKITSDDLDAAKSLDCTIKLLSIASRSSTRTAARASPRALSARPARAPARGCHGAYNAVVVESANAGRLMFYGQGAGGAPTASAVMGDPGDGRAQQGARRPRARASPSTRSCRSRRGGRTPHPLLREHAGRRSCRRAVGGRRRFANRGVSISTVRQEGPATVRASWSSPTSQTTRHCRKRLPPLPNSNCNRCDQRAPTGRYSE